jgi:hypothetical protein
MSLAEKARKAADEAVQKKQWWAEMTTSIEKVSADGGYETRSNMVYRGGSGPKKGGPETDTTSIACSCGAPSCDRCHGG